MNLRDVRSAMLAKASTSCLTPADVKLLRFEPFVEGHELDIQPRWAGFKLPYFTPTGKPDSFFRFRYLQTQPSTGWGSVAAAPEKPRRYTQPQGTQCGIYLPPLLDSTTWKDIASDPSVRLVITEGELKAACACKFGIPCIGLGGVFNWQSKKEMKELLPALESYVWKGRAVITCFDSDAASNPMVAMACSRLAHVLTARGAVVHIAQLPPTAEGAKQGLDDFIFTNGIDPFYEILINAECEERNSELHRLNDEVAVVRSTSEIIELRTGNVYTASAFADVVYRNREYPVKDEKTERMVMKPVAKDWLRWPCRTEVSRIDYAPDCNNMLTEDGAYNTWHAHGWAVQPSKKGTIEPWEKLFAFLMEGLTPETQLWVRRWFAYPLHFPSTKLNTAVLVWGREQGTGKTMLGDSMKHIYGANYGTVNNLMLTGNFNEWAQDKQFIVGDEISLGDKRGTANALKDMITRTHLRLNIKNRKTFVIRDCINYYFTSNHEDAVYLEASDRRIFVHAVQQPRPMPQSEYAAYMRWLTKEGGAARLFHYLKYELDLGDFDPAARAPVTTSKLEMTASSRSDVEDWCHALAQDPGSVIPVDIKFDLFTTKELLMKYDPHEKGWVKSVGFGRALNAAGVFRVARGSNKAIINGSRAGLWAVRNVDKYRAMSISEAQRCYEAERPLLRKVGDSKKFATSKAN